MYPVNPVGICYVIIDVYSTYGIVRADSDMINVIGRNGKLVAVYSCDEPYTFLSFLLEVDFAVTVVIFRIDDKGVVFLGVCATCQGNAEYIFAA